MKGGAKRRTSKTNKKSSRRRMSKRSLKGGDLILRNLQTHDLITFTDADFLKAALKAGSKQKVDLDNAGVASRYLTLNNNKTANPPGHRHTIPDADWNVLKSIKG